MNLKSPDDREVWRRRSRRNKGVKERSPILLRPDFVNSEWGMGWKGVKWFEELKVDPEKWEIQCQWQNLLKNDTDACLTHSAGCLSFVPLIVGYSQFLWNDSWKLVATICMKQKSNTHNFYWMIVESLSQFLWNKRSGITKFKLTQLFFFICSSPYCMK